MERLEILSAVRLHIGLHHYENILCGVLFGNCSLKLLGLKSCDEYFYHFKNYFIFFLFTRRKSQVVVIHSFNKYFFSVYYVPGRLLGTEYGAVTKVKSLLTWSWQLVEGDGQYLIIEMYLLLSNSDQWRKTIIL